MPRVMPASCSSSRLRALFPLACLSAASAAAPLSAQVEYTTPGSAYVQDFNLPAAAENALLAWQDNITLPGWFAALYDGNRDAHSAPEHLLPTSGLGRNEIGFYLYRADPPRSEKKLAEPARIDAALGARPSDALCPGIGSGGVFYGVALVNKTGATLDALRLTYRVELWRLAATAAPQSTLAVSCRVGGEGIVYGSWMPVSGSHYTTPRGGGGEGAQSRSVDGNAPENISTFTDLRLAGLALAPGQTLWIRWFDVNNRSADHGVGIDDVRITLLP